MRSLANTEGQDLLHRSEWPETMLEATFTTLATESQGVLSDLAPGYDYIINDTFWNRTATRPITGPLSPAERQRQKSSNVTGPYFSWYTRGTSLYFFPTTAAGQTCSFEYSSLHWCESSLGAGQAAWAADDDVGRLSEYLMKLGIIWRFKKANGLGYAEEFNTYEAEVKAAVTRSGGKKKLNMNGRPGWPSSGLGVPDGSWPL